MTNVEYKADVAELRRLRGKTHIDPQIEIANVRCDDTMLWITLTDGRVIGSPLAWSPPLLEATPEQRAHWRLSPTKTGIH